MTINNYETTSSNGENQRYSVQPQTTKYNTAKEFEPMFSSSGMDSRNENRRIGGGQNNTYLKGLAQSTQGSELPLLKNFITKNHMTINNGMESNIKPFYEFLEENAKKRL